MIEILNSISGSAEAETPEAAFLAARQLLIEAPDGTVRREVVTSFYVNDKVVGSVVGWPERSTT